MSDGVLKRMRDGEEVRQHEDEHSLRELNEEGEIFLIASLHILPLHFVRSLWPRGGELQDHFALFPVRECTRDVMRDKEKLSGIEVNALYFLAPQVSFERDDVVKQLLLELTEIADGERWDQHMQNHHHHGAGDGDIKQDPNHKCEKPIRLASLRLPHREEKDVEEKHRIHRKQQHPSQQLEDRGDLGELERISTVLCFQNLSIQPWQEISDEEIHESLLFVLLTKFRISQESLLLGDLPHHFMKISQ